MSLRKNVPDNRINLRSFPFTKHMSQMEHVSLSILTYLNMILLNIWTADMPGIQYAMSMTESLIL